MSATLDIVIVSYRARAAATPRAASVREHGAGAEMTVSVVDNASGDGTAEMVAAEFPEVTLLAQQEPRLRARAEHRHPPGDRRGGAGPQPRRGPRGGRHPRAAAGPARGRSADRLLRAALIREDGSFDHAARRTFPTRSAPWVASPGSGGGWTAAFSRHTGRLTSSEGPSTRSTARSCCCAAPPSTTSVSSTRATGCTWRTSTSARLKEGGWITFYEPASRALHTKSGHDRGRARTEN